MIRDQWFLWPAAAVIFTLLLRMYSRQGDGWAGVIEAERTMAAQARAEAAAARAEATQARHEAEIARAESERCDQRNVALERRVAELEWQLRVLKGEA